MTDAERVDKMRALIRELRAEVERYAYSIGVDRLQTIEVTSSQRMALEDMLCDAVNQAARHRGTEVYIDCSKSPAVETRPSDLLAVVAEFG